MKLLIAAALALALSAGAAPAGHAESAYEIASGANQALARLYQASPVARSLARRARAILVFPRIAKASLLVGGAHGEGELMVGRSVGGYYKLESESLGPQVGAETHQYVVFLITPSAVKDVQRGPAWQLGHGPTLLLVNRNAPANLATAPMRYDAYGFVFNQRGLIAGIGAEGTRISHDTDVITTTAAAKAAPSRVMPSSASTSRASTARATASRVTATRVAARTHSAPAARRPAVRGRRGGFTIRFSG